MTDTEETEYLRSYDRGHACGNYLLGGGHDRDRLVDDFDLAVTNRRLAEFLYHHDCKLDLTGRTRTWLRDFAMGIRHAFHSYRLKSP